MSGYDTGIHIERVEESQENSIPAQKIGRELEETYEGFNNDLHMCGSQKEEEDRDGQKYIDIKHVRCLPWVLVEETYACLQVALDFDKGGIGVASPPHVEVTNLA